jgi:CubicO group peptidase (beta-lactamase class C family)
MFRALVSAAVATSLVPAAHGSSGSAVTQAKAPAPGKPIALYRLAANSQAAPASTRSVATDPRLKTLIDRFAAEVLQNKRSAGLAVGVAEKGRIRFIGGYGLADLENKVPVNEQTVFRIGSITKEFTAAAVLLLAERGKLSIDDPLQKYFPEFPRGGEVTLRHLLNHTSGIYNYTSLEDFYPAVSRQDRSVADMVVYISTSKPLYEFDPGTAWSYSNSGYMLLGAIVEKVSGQPFERFLEANILDPLGLDDTSIDDLAEIVPNRASGYDKNDDAPGGFINTSFISMHTPAAAGAMRSTASDLLTWHQALLSGKLLKPASVALMIQPGRLKDGRDSSLGKWGDRSSQAPPGEYGLGMMMAQRSGRRSIGHGGSINGFNAWLLTFPDDQVTIVLLANTSRASNALTPELVEAIFRERGR